MKVKITVKGKTVYQEITDAQILEHVQNLEIWEHITTAVAYEQYMRANPGVLNSMSDVFA